MADADTTDFDVDAEAPGGGVREDTATDADEKPHAWVTG